jgi:eukaryotic-like serine/threonine-protein kinase
VNTQASRSAIATVPRIGRYQILERIGAGGMAEAFRARASGPGGYQRDLIIKRILPHLARETDFIRSFVDEAKILGMLNHPNVVGVYDFGVDEDRHYLALEFLDGPSVAEILTRVKKRDGQIPVAVAAYIAREVCKGLAAVHALRGPDGRALEVIHRDVSPSNVMTTTAGAVKLLDFGLAKIGAAQKVTKQGYIKGKAGYLAPEQIKGAPIDSRVDIFSLGVVLHEMLCLEHLFYGEGGDIATVYRIIEMEIPPPSRARGEVPAAIDEIVFKALARDPDKRYPSAADMARDLDDVVAAAGLRVDDMAAFVRENLTAPTPK